MVISVFRSPGSAFMGLEFSLGTGVLENSVVILLLL